ncbi:hypothetical protein C0989_008980 [Termitomyces sp. Mn162]|nr:hypothetical protein C0989_008980 [Termitomyces sp. Mn162]
MVQYTTAAGKLSLALLGACSHIQAQIVDVYRSKLRDDLTGPEGNEIARKRIEDYANKIRPAGFLDHIRIHSIDLGVSAPKLHDAHVTSDASPKALTVTISPPPPDSPAPVLTFSISPNFTLDLTTTSLIGSRAKLANVPKLHELIQHQVRRILAARGTWQVVLPGLATLSAVQEQAKKSLHDV